MPLGSSLSCPRGECDDMYRIKVQATEQTWVNKALDSNKDKQSQAMSARPARVVWDISDEFQVPVK